MATLKKILLDNTVVWRNVFFCHANNAKTVDKKKENVVKIRYFVTSTFSNDKI